LHRVVEDGAEVFDRQHLQELPDLYTRQLHRLGSGSKLFGILFDLTKCETSSRSWRTSHRYAGGGL